jgi:hypothetical protein
MKLPRWSIYAGGGVLVAGGAYKLYRNRTAPPPMANADTPSTYTVPAGPFNYTGAASTPYIGTYGAQPPGPIISAPMPGPIIPAPVQPVPVYVEPLIDTVS